MAILRRTERAMVRTTCGAKLVEKKRTEDLMEMLGLKETVVQMAKVNGVRWYRHVLRRDDGHVLRKEFTGINLDQNWIDDELSESEGSRSN